MVVGYLNFHVGETEIVVGKLPLVFRVVDAKEVFGIYVVEEDESFGAFCWLFGDAHDIFRKNRVATVLRLWIVSCVVLLFRLSNRWCLVCFLPTIGSWCTARAYVPSALESSRRILDNSGVVLVVLRLLPHYEG